MPSWWPTENDSAVLEYVGAHYEFNIAWKSRRPYRSNATGYFRWVKQYSGWKMRSHAIGDSLTADILATIDLLALPRSGRHDIGSPGGRGPEQGEWWLPILDGGVYVAFTQSEHENTNRVSATRRTWIFGSNAYRFLTAALGFTVPDRRYPGEGAELTADARRLLLERQSTSGTPEHRDLVQSAAVWPPDTLSYA